MCDERSTSHSPSVAVLGARPAACNPVCDRWETNKGGTPLRYRAASVLPAVVLSGPAPTGSVDLSPSSAAAIRARSLGPDFAMESVNSATEDSRALKALGASLG